jgi:hypothetical protein
MRSEPVRKGDPERGRFEYSPAKREQPRRANAVLRNLARGHALVQGRRHLTGDDLPLLARVVVSSMPSECGPVFAALVKRGGTPLTVAEVQEILHVKSRDTARSVMEELDRREVLQFERKGEGKAAVLSFRPKWEWCASPEFQGYLFAEPVKNRGLCVLPVTPDPPDTPNLVERQKERGRGEEYAHTSQKLTGSNSSPALLSDIDIEAQEA